MSILLLVILSLSTPQVGAPKSKKVAIEAPLAFLQFGQTRLLFGDTTLGEVMGLTHSGEVHEYGDAVRTSWLCYRLGNAATLFLISDNMGAPRKVLTSFVAQDKLEEGAACQELPITSFATDKGIRFGMSRDAVLEKLGKPTYENQDRLQYNFKKDATKKEGGKKLSFTAQSFLELRFSAGKVSEMSGYRVDTDSEEIN